MRNATCAFTYRINNTASYTIHAPDQLSGQCGNYNMRHNRTQQLRYYTMWQRSINIEICFPGSVISKIEIIPRYLCLNGPRTDYVTVWWILCGLRRKCISLAKINICSVALFRGDPRCRTLRMYYYCIQLMLNVIMPMDHCDNVQNIYGRRSYHLFIMCACVGVETHVYTI